MQSLNIKLSKNNVTCFLNKDLTILYAFHLTKPLRYKTPFIKCRKALVAQKIARKNTPTQLCHTQPQNGINLRYIQRMMGLACSKTN
jgi:hypothetical protein